MPRKSRAYSSVGNVKVATSPLTTRVGCLVLGIGRLLVGQDSDGDALSTPLRGAKVWVGIELLLIVGNACSQAALVGSERWCCVGQPVDSLGPMRPAHNSPVPVPPVKDG